MASLSALLYVSGCNPDAVEPNDELIALSESIIDAFYSWDEHVLESRLGAAAGGDAMLYYQKWAEAAHYRVEERRRCEQLSPTDVLCAITVTDDFGTTLGYMATDSFTIEFDGNVPSRIDFEGDDPVVFMALFVWMAVYQSDVLDGDCKDMFDGGTTPARCARAVADAAVAFEAWSPFD